jgi:hypothetical protein
MHNLMMVAKQHWNAITSDGAALFCCDALCLEMCTLQVDIAVQQVVRY